MKESAALALAHSALASVISFETGLSTAQRFQNRLGDVVAALFALAVVAGHREERGRMLDLNTANVRGLRHDVAGVLLHDLELEAFELGDFALEAGSFVFAAAPFAGALGRFTESSMVHEFLKDKPSRMAAGRAQRVASTRLYRKSVATVADALLDTRA